MPGYQLSSRAFIPIRKESHMARRRNRARKQLMRLGRKEGWICWLCLKEVDPRATGDWAPTRDHVIPRSFGGRDNLRNYRLAHQICNNERGNDLWLGNRSLI
jgi:5-methylcytosine-specific restriction endonuclease McrA